jgi:hypothetical protein
MTGPLLLATAACVLRPTFLLGLRPSSSLSSSSPSAAAALSISRRILVGGKGNDGRRGVSVQLRLFATDPSSQLASLVESHVSRLSTLQTLLQRHGAPGSQGCTRPNDLFSVSGPIMARMETPELIASLSNTTTTTIEPVAMDEVISDKKLNNLHPYLFPICQSVSTGNLICAYRDPGREREIPPSSSTTTSSSLSTTTSVTNPPKPWPIVEAKVGGPGFHVLALNSEHLLRRIVCEVDFTDSDSDLIALYNEGLGQGRLNDATLDTIYVPGSVTKLGYGVDKYVLLKVGPFPDLYERMARQHYTRGDEASALIAAETANGKISGFASTFRFYARLLSSFPHRSEEVRDAARMCLRMSLPTIGMNLADYEEVATLGNMSNEFDTPITALQKLGDMYKLIKSVEKDDDKVVKNPVELALDEANDLINDTVLECKEWSSVRPQLSQLFRSIGREDMAAFIDV